MSLAELPQPPPQALLFDTVTSFWKSQTLYAATVLGFADHLKDGPKTATQIAELAGVDASSAFRVLRALASIGIFQEVTGNAFQNNAVSDTLRVDHPHSTRVTVLAEGGPIHYKGWSNFVETVKTGKPGLFSVHGVSDYFETFQKFPEFAKDFSQHMTAMSAAQIPLIFQAYPEFSKITSYVDVGGSEGLLTVEALKHFPNIEEGYSYDLPKVVSLSHLAGQEPGRFHLVGGNFFENPSGIPEGKDLYSTKFVLHDWNDEKALAILKNIAHAARPDSKILLIEGVVGERGQEFFKWADLHMMQICGGRFRTRYEWSALALQAGLEISKVIATPGLQCVIVLVKIK